jgi:hypothetical protein
MVLRVQAQVQAALVLLVQAEQTDLLAKVIQ